MINITKRNGLKEPLDITKIQKMTNESVEGLLGTSQSELELDAKIKFIDGMSSADIQDALIKTAVEKIDIDVPNWTFAAARLFIFDLYHKVGKNVNGSKGKPYGSFKDNLDFLIEINKMVPTIYDGYDVEDLEAYIKPERDLLFNYLGIKTLYDKYLIKDNQKQPVELPQYMFMAISMFLNQNEENKQEKAKDLYDIISKFEVMLATPTLSSARKLRPQLSSCYIGSTPDNIEGIFDAYQEMALLSKHGGGIGWDWNQVRSQGGVIDDNLNAAGGTTPFLKITNDIAIAVDQLGVRKGAIAVYLEPWHMDIDDFIDLKKNSGEERRRAHDLFPALWLCDLFMERIDTNGTWTLFDPYEVPDLHTLNGSDFNRKYEEYEKDETKTKKVIKAKDLWKKILTSYFESGSPFLCFKDTANRGNPNSHVGNILSSNLCTEIFQNTKSNTYEMKIYIEGTKNNEEYITLDENTYILLKGGYTKKAKNINALDTIVGIGTDDKLSVSVEDDILMEPIKVYCVEKEKTSGKTAVCNLASINLSRVNTKSDLERVIPIIVRALDNVIDLNYYPLKKVKDTNLDSRAIGLGVMGEAQMLAESQIYWGSQEHFTKIDDLMEIFSYNTIKASADLAIEKGVYPTFEGSKWSKGLLPHDNYIHAVFELTDQDRDSQYYWEDLREQLKTTGIRNGYLMAIAPTSSISILVGTTQAIEPVYKRKWYEENLSGLIPVVVPKLSPDTYEYYTPAFEIDQLKVIKAAAIRQKWVDQGQSTNIFMSLDKASGKHLHEIYTLAWKLGLKSTYYLRSQSPEAANDVEDRSMECSGCQ